jgi:hypothetical protein
MRQLKLFIGRPSDKLSGGIMAFARKQCRLVTGLLTGQCTLRWHLHIVGLSESAKRQEVFTGGFLLPCTLSVPSVD